MVGTQGNPVPISPVSSNSKCDLSHFFMNDKYHIQQPSKDFRPFCSPVNKHHRRLFRNNDISCSGKFANTMPVL